MTTERKADRKMNAEAWEGRAVTSESFEIVIKGTLSEPVADLIDGFEISKVEHGETHLVGFVPDQTKLQGILTIFGNLNIELVSVNPVPNSVSGT
ncbi:hypothetical protein [Mycetocola sp. 2940]|uniref:hypothetical protein n=1 Tax=Mycetocola sp. 2940 TaxID=3156452 RepID=UPI003396EDB6